MKSWVLDAGGLVYLIESIGPLGWRVSAPGLAVTSRDLDTALRTVVRLRQL